MQAPPLVSVCIPVYDTEPYLAQCLRSLYSQDFDGFEVLVLSDRSPGKDEKGRTAKKIVKAAQKECDRYRKERGLSPVSFRFFEHRENRGCVEVRRSLVYEAKGKFLAMLDSDDELMEGALTALYGAALSYEADIVHGTFISGHYDGEGLFHESLQTKCGKIYYGTKEGLEIAKGWFSGLYNGNLCGKLIAREVYEKAFSEIPYTECNMADDLLIFFFAGMSAHRYVGIENKVYRYRINSGMSSHRLIDSLKKWQMICTSASVFAIISQWVKEKGSFISPEDRKHLGLVTLGYLESAVHQLHDSVLPELQEKARAMLDDAWGQDFVNNVWNAIYKK